MQQQKKLTHGNLTNISVPLFPNCNIANTTTIRVLKNRYSGDTGVASHLFFNGDTGRLTEVDNLGDNGEEDNLEEAL